jgi:hypothetical protein
MNIIVDGFYIKSKSSNVSGFLQALYLFRAYPHSGTKTTFMCNRSLSANLLQVVIMYNSCY